MRAWLGRGGPDLAELLPEIRDRLPDLPASPPLDPAQARFRLLDSTASFIERAAATRAPLLLVLDDLHAADELSLLVTRFLSRAARDSPLLLLGTYRPAEARQAAGVAQLIEGVARETTVLHLEGFSLAEVRQYLRQTLAVPPSPALVSAVHDRTDGNPLFVAELGRILPPRAAAGAESFEPPPELLAAIA